MGYCMSYKRFIRRNPTAQGGYANKDVNGTQLAGDLRRMECDQLDDRHVADWGRVTGIEPAKVRELLTLFLTTDCARYHALVAFEPQPPRGP